MSALDLPVLIFLYDGMFGEIEGSKGLQKMIDQNAMVTKIMMGPGTIEKLAKRCGASSRMIKLQMNKLIKLGLVRAEEKGKKTKYYPLLEFPNQIKQFKKSLKREVPEGRLMEPHFEPSKKLYKLLGIKNIGNELIYVPYAFFRTQKGKQIWVNLSDGKIEERRIKLKI